MKMDPKTVYICVFIFSAFQGIAIHYLNIRKGSKYFLFWFSFFVTAFFLCTNTGSSDFVAYEQLYNESSLSMLVYTNQEKGFVLLNILMKLLIHDAVWGVNALRFLALFVFFIGAFSMREEIDLGLSVIAIISLAFIPIFTMVAFMLAAGLILLEFICIYKRKKYLAFLFGLLAFSVHYSSAGAQLFLILYYVLFISKFKKRYIVPLGIGISMLFIYLAPRLYWLAVDRVSFFAKYSVYGVTSATGSGLLQIVRLLPLLFIFINILQEERSSDIFKTSFSLFVLALIFGQVAYSFVNFQRMFAYSLFLFIVFVPYVGKVKNERRYFCIRILPEDFAYYWFFIAYFSWRYFDYLNTFWYSSQLFNYNSLVF